jgi:Arc/MetJ-type ribon-helix-helix transcriptional regulator
MALQLSPRIQQRISEKVASGAYPDADTVIEKALDQLSEHEKFVRLKALIAVGVEQTERGETIEYTQELRREIRESARRRYLAGEKPDPDVCP